MYFCPPKSSLCSLGAFAFVHGINHSARNVPSYSSAQLCLASKASSQLSDVAESKETGSDIITGTFWKVDRCSFRYNELEQAASQVAPLDLRLHSVGKMNSCNEHDHGLQILLSL